MLTGRLFQEKGTEAKKVAQSQKQGKKRLKAGYQQCSGNEKER